MSTFSWERASDHRLSAPILPHTRGVAYKRNGSGSCNLSYFVIPEKSSGARYLLHEMRRSGGYALQETQGVWVKTLQSLP
jgi:hypothetical protein